MFDLLSPVAMYLADSVLSVIYTRSFLKEKYEKRGMSVIWVSVYFLIHILIFIIGADRFPVGKVVGIILNICILLFMQSVFFQQDIQKQFFITFSFVAGTETAKYMFITFDMVVSGWGNKILDHLLAEDILNTIEKTVAGITIYNAVMAVLCVVFYILLLFGYLFFINRKYVKKDYPLQTHENVFLLSPGIAALCISVIIRLIISTLYNGMGIVIYDAVPAIRFWLTVIGALMLSDIIASAVLFQKQIQYHEEAGKRAMLENQVLQMQKEIVEIQDIYTDMRGLRHDMRSHLANISLLVKGAADSVDEELEGYIGKMEETVGKLDFAGQTGNPITDVIIHWKSQEAEKKQIPFQVDFAYPNKLAIDVYDIAVILNNALENAIEACGKVEGESQIRLRSYVRGRLFFIEVENDFSGDIAIDKESGLPVSSKGNGKRHGIGISNIQRCARKYMGDIDIAVSNTGGRKKFSLTVMMNGKAGADG